MSQPSIRHVFMSYSRKDEAVMRRVVAFLRKQGINVWVDNEKLIPGTPIWETEIEKAITNAGAVVVLLSPDSKNSPWVRREISYAEDNDKRIFPILVEGNERDTIPIRLTNHQRIDIRTNEEVGLNSLATALSFYLENLEAQERKAREEAEKLALAKAEQLAKQKAEEERLAKEKLELERKAREEAERLAAQKAEEERIAKARIKSERLAEQKHLTEEKAEAERKAQQRNEQERLAKVKIESERRITEEPSGTITQDYKKKELEGAVPAQTKFAKFPLLSIGVAGGAIVALVVCGYAAINLLGGFPTATPPVNIPPTATEADVTKPPADPNALPRNETLYFNGQQWGSVVCWNPYSSSCNNAMAINQQDNARVLMFETPYLYNMLDGKQYPLLADGAYVWNDAHTEITFKLKKAAHWNDGTPVTAEDAAYTWATHVKYSTITAVTNKDYIENIEAKDPQTVVVKAKLDADGKAVNPLIVQAYLSTNYVIQKAWTQTLEKRVNNDAAALVADTAEDVVYSGPYHKYFADDSKVVLIRDDNYWGKDASMFGKLPVPRYLAHIIYTDNNAGLVALQAGEVDVSQQFNSNVQDLWLKDNLSISTYLPDAPYGIGASLSTAFYNLNSYGLDQIAVRKAIAIAVDYPTIIANAMTDQSATFDQVPRSLMNPTSGEQALYDHAAVKDLQWSGNDIEGAKELLDAAGIVDTDGDGWREYNGQKLHYVATCPNGWSDWQAAIEVVAAAGKEVGIDITTNYPEWSIYYTVITKSDAPFPEGYDIFMMWSDGAGPTQPWGRIRHLLSSEFVGMPSNWDGNWGQYSNPEADALINAIPNETDPTKLKEMYTELVDIYLTDVPSFTLMYRPQSFYTVNESVWTNFPHADDGTNPPVPPLDLMDGWSVAGLYNLKLVK